MAKFGEAFGLPKDRFKLTTGLKDFWIFRIEITKSKKLYDVKETQPDGSVKILKKLIDIAYMDTYPDIDGKPNKEEVIKYFAPNAPIVSGCKDMLAAYGKHTKDGTLSEPVFIEEVKGKIGEGQNEYLFFT
jgi:hypothetical protein